MTKNDIVIPFTPPNPEKITQEGKNKFIGCWLFLCAEMALFFYLLMSDLGAGKSFIPETEIFLTPLGLIATIVIIISSVTGIFAFIEMKRYDMFWMQICYGATLVFGGIFLGIEIYLLSGSTFQAFSSSAGLVTFYLLLSIHAAHILFGTVWIILLMLQTYKKGINVKTAPKIYFASTYWGFAGMMWMLIFSGIIFF